MTDHQLAFLRTLQPVLFGAAIGVLFYLALTYVPVQVLGVAAAFGILIWVTVLAYQMNLDSVRRERKDK